MTAESLKSGGRSPSRARADMRPAGESARESCVRSIAGVEEGEDMAVEVTLEVEMAEDVRAGDLQVGLCASSERVLLLALAAPKPLLEPSRLFIAPNAMMAIRTSSSSASIPRRLTAEVDVEGRANSREEVRSSAGGVAGVVGAGVEAALAAWAESCSASARCVVQRSSWERLESTVGSMLIM